MDDPFDALDRALVARIEALPERPPLDVDAPVRPGCGLSGRRALELFESQLESRHLDGAARRLRAGGRGYYTIGSSGHEGNAAVACALRPTDPCLLHYRSGAFFVERARAEASVDALRDVLLGCVAGRDEPIAGGRHKVFGSRPLLVPPQTSTIASHLPKAMGLAFALDQRRHLGAGVDLPDDAIVMCSFGDASASHSTAVGAVNAARHTAFQRLPMPLLLVCEDNGLGISVPTPPGFVEATFAGREDLRYLHADGCDLLEAFAAASEAVAWVRERRRPALLHLSVVRLLGHAGSDVEAAYRTPAQLREGVARDPLARTAAILAEAGVSTPAALLRLHADVRARVDAIAREVSSAEPLRDADDVMWPLSPRRPEVVAAEAARLGSATERARLHGERLPEAAGPLTLCQQLNSALADLLAAHPGALVFGEDVARKGGVYGVTRGLHRRAGVRRVFDTLLDEQSILGLALGAAQAGLLPIPEIQYLAYLHNAEDQLRGEAATLSFFSQGAFRNGLVVRVAAYAYQRGFGGHFHNDGSVAVLRDVPGLVIASPSRGDDAAAMLRTCVAAARVDGTVCVFLEPIALYHERDLHDEGDQRWATPYAPGDAAPLGVGRTHGDGRDLLLVSFANGVRMSLRVAARLADRGVSARVLDLRWLSPMPTDDLLREAGECAAVLVVDETRRTGGVAEGVLAELVDAGHAGPMARVTSRDCFVPLGDAARHVLLSEGDIESAALQLLGV